VHNQLWNRRNKGAPEAPIGTQAENKSAKADRTFGSLFDLLSSLFFSTSIPVGVRSSSLFRNDKQTFPWETNEL
jgi:hypothetical protein